MDNKQNINDKIDQAIFESEEEIKNGAKPISAEEAKRMLDEKYFERNSVNF